MKAFKRIRVQTRNGRVDKVFVRGRHCAMCNRRGSYVTAGVESLSLCLSCLFEESGYTRIDLPTGINMRHHFKESPEYPRGPLVNHLNNWAEQVGDAHTRGRLNDIKAEMRRVADDLTLQ